jgi:UPF0716 protein FxsA
MNTVLLLIILVPVIEIFLFIKIGSQIGAITTIFLIFTTAIVGVYYAKYEGLNTLRSGFAQISNNKAPAYEVISGAAIAFAAILLIIPGFATDIIGFLIIFPITRNFFLEKIFLKFKEQENETKKNNFIDGEFEDIEDDNDKKI